MINIFPEIKNHFDALQDRLCVFGRHGVQVEGWFKGELLQLLDSMAQRSKICKVNREVRIDPNKRAKVDLAFTTSNNTENWVELKHWTGSQKGRIYDPKAYFGDKVIGIFSDVGKLKIAGGQKWVLVLLTPNTSDLKWSDGVDTFNKKFSQLIRPYSTPSQFSKNYFLGLLQV